MAKKLPGACRDTYHSRSVIYDKRIKLNHFQGQSTYECDYRYYFPKKRWIYKWPQETMDTPEKPMAEEASTTFDTLAKWRQGYKPPFNLWWEPKPIVGTNPYDKMALKHINCTIEEPQDSEEKIVQKPTTLLSPAVQITEIENPADKDIILSNMYKTEWSRATEEAAQATFTKWNVAPPLSSTLDPNKSLAYKADIFPALPVGWREKGREWDSTKDRAAVDPTKAFWLRAPLQETEIMASTRLVSNEVKQEISGLIAEEKLRQPHDKICVSYAGYKPANPRGVTLRRKDLPIEHPGLSVNETIRCRYRDEII